MQPDRHRHLRGLNIAREALDLGARRTVVQQMTGLSRAELRRVFGSCSSLIANHGGRPSSVHKLFHGRELHLQACDFYNGFRLLVGRGVSPDEALLAAYRRYRARHADETRLGFDRAFSIVAATRGLWTSKAPSLHTMRCPACHALHLVPVMESAPCPYCKTAQRARSTHRRGDVILWFESLRP